MKLNMSKGRDKLKESLSALMDNEASEFEFRRVLKESAVDSELKHKWERYHLISGIIKGELGKSPENISKVGVDLLSRINAELDGENPRKKAMPDHAAGGQNSSNKTSQGFLRRMGQGAIAASVAALVLISVNPSVTQAPLENGTQMAGQDMTELGVPVFDDNYAPTEFSRIPRLSNEIAGMETMDEAARDRLRQAVYQEFVGEPRESIELPVNFSVTREFEQK